MAKNAFSQWDPVAVNNTDIGGIGVVGGSAVSNFDDAFREIMAQLKLEALNKSGDTFTGNIVLGGFSLSGTGTINGTIMQRNSVNLLAVGDTIPQSDVTDLIADLLAKADKTITVTAGSGLTGGGTLAASMTLQAEYSDQPEAEAGTDNTKLMTSLRTAQAIAAQSPGAVLATEQATTSGTSIDFTGIPAGTKKITVMFVGVSVSGGSDLLVQLGDAGGVEASGYSGSGAALTSAANTSASSTTGFLMKMGGSGAQTYHGSLELNLENIANFTWVAHGATAWGADADIALTAGSKSTSTELDRIRITTVNGSDTFDAGAINIKYE